MSPVSTQSMSRFDSAQAGASMRMVMPARQQVSDNIWYCCSAIAHLQKRQQKHSSTAPSKFCKGIVR